MRIVETLLTPELAAQFLANPHPRQRRLSRVTVADYARAIREGRWILSPDPILLTPEGQLLNGGQPDPGFRRGRVIP